MYLNLKKRKMDRRPLFGQLFFMVADRGMFS